MSVCQMSVMGNVNVSLQKCEDGLHLQCGTRGTCVQVSQSDLHAVSSSVQPVSVWASPQIDMFCLFGVLTINVDDSYDVFSCHNNSNSQ